MTDPLSLPGSPGFTVRSGPRGDASDAAHLDAPRGVGESVRAAQEARGIGSGWPRVPDSARDLLRLIRQVAGRGAPSQGTHPPSDWHIRQMRFPEALDYARDQGRPFTGRFPIAVLDTGYSDHPSLVEWRERTTDRGRNYVPGRGWWPGDTGDTQDGRDVSSALRPLEWSGHGTGTIYAITGTKDEKGPGGVLPGAQVVPYRTARSIFAFSGEPAFQAARDAMRGPTRVINLNHIVVGNLAPVRLAIASAYERGVIVVVPVGSHGLPLRRSVSGVARSPHVIAVAGSDPAGDPWRGSAFSGTHGDPNVVVSAPAVEILGPEMQRSLRSPIERPGFGWWDGTTFSAAYVSAAAALWQEFNADALAARYPQPWQTVEAFRTLLAATARPFNTLQRPGLYGGGVVDARALLEAPLPDAKSLRRARD